MEESITLTDIEPLKITLETFFDLKFDVDMVTARESFEVYFELKAKPLSFYDEQSPKQPTKKLTMVLTSNGLPFPQTHSVSLKILGDKKIHLPLKTDMEVYSLDSIHQIIKINIHESQV